MEKKREKEIDFKLTSEADSAELIEEVLPELIASEEENTEPIESPKENAKSQSAALVNKQSANSASQRVLTQGTASSEAPILSAKKRRVTFRAVLIGVTALAIGAGLTQTWRWYRDAPRSELRTVEFSTPTFLGGLIGDPDAAFAVQMVPVLVNDYTTSGNPKYGGMVTEVQKQFAFEATRRFIENSPGDKSLSILTMGTALSARGQSAEAVRTMRPLIDKTDNPAMKGYLGLLLHLTGDLPASLTELDKGIAYAKTGKVWMSDSGSSNIYTLKSAVLRAMGRPEEALAVLDSPECAEWFKTGSYNRESMLLTKAAAYLHLGQPDKAIKLACECKQLNHMILSTAYLMKGDYGEAITQADQSYLALSRIYSQQGRLTEALEYAKLADSAVDSMTTREQHVFVLNQLKHFKDALSISNDLAEYSKLSNASGSAEALVQIHADRAYAFAELGDTRNALLEANLALGNNPGCRQALEAARLASTKSNDLANAARFENRLRQLKSTRDVRPVAFSTKNDKKD
ncbi:hypothetical protein BH10CYA1_BH10CYA1_45320 [soil metagenome]